MPEEALLIDTLRQTNRCRNEVKKTADLFAGFCREDYESLITKLIDGGEDRALGILLNICALKRIKLDPHVLADTLKVVKELPDFAYPYQDQDRDAIAPLLDVAEAEDISIERQAFAGRLAAELTVKYNEERNAVKKLLMKQHNRFRSHDLSNMLIDESLYLLSEGEDDHSLHWLTQLDVLEELPEEKPPVVVGGLYTIRRPVPKIGRNAPCPCGSGKKYKKCCYEKDQEVLRDASPYEGVTMTQARSSPGLVDGIDIIEEMRAYQLKKLKPPELNDDQLLAAYRRADIFGLREFALAMLLELKSRPGKEEFAVGHMEDLLYSSLNADDLEVAKKIEKHIPPDKLHDNEGTRFHLDLLENREWFAGLEERCRQALKNDKEELVWSSPLVDLSYNFENLFPALSIIFSRAAIVDMPESFFDNEMLLEVIRNGRTDLDLDPWADPIEDYLDWATEKIDTDFELEEKQKVIEELKQKVSEIHRREAGKERELREKELQLSDLIKKTEKEGESRPVPVGRSDDTHLEGVVDQSDTVLQLRQRIDRLKMEVRTQQHERRKLRNQLQDTQKKAHAKRIVTPSESSVIEHSPDFEKTPKKIPIPEYTDVFRGSCESMPPVIVAKALRAAAGFAAQDQDIRRQSRRLERIPDVYRIRIGSQHRLLIRWESGPRLEILDLINRQSLETWIKRRLG